MDRRDCLAVQSFGVLSALLKLTALAVLPFCHTTARAGKSPVALVTVTPIVDEVSSEFDAVQISMNFDGEPDGETLLTLPDEWGGEAGLHRYITDLRLKGGEIVKAEVPHQRVLRHRAGARLTLQYRIPRNQDRIPGSKSRVNDYRPLVTSSYFHLIGHAIFAVPGGMSETARLKVKLGRVATGQTLVSDLEHAAPDGTVSLKQLQQSITVGGDFKLLDVGGSARMAVRGKVDGRDEDQWRTSFQRIAAAQRSFWGNQAEPFLVTIIAVEPKPGQNSTGGTALGDAFAFFTTGNVAPSQLDHVMAHEFVHSWVPEQIGGIDLALETEPEAYWLSEGFTEYLTMRMMVRAGHWNAADFAAKFNDAVEEWTRSTAVAKPNAELAARFWSDNDANRMPYLRGMLFATLLDSELRRQSGGASNLDNVFLFMRRNVANGHGGDAITQLRLALDEAGLNGDALIQRHIERAVPIDLREVTFAPCGKVAIRYKPRWVLGFDLAATSNARLVSGVVKDGAAWRAGLRDGMKVSGWSVSNGDTTKLAQITIVENGQPRIISWLPVADPPLAVQTLELGDEAESKACLVRLGRAH